MTLMTKNAKAVVLCSVVSLVFLLCAAVSCSGGEKNPSPSVSETDAPVSSVQPVDVSLSDTGMELGFGITRQLTAVGGEQIKWQSSDDGIASVDDQGNVKGMEPGECVISASNEFGRTAECRVTVKKTCYLTIDDGPRDFVGKLLDTLKENDVKVTFFLIDSRNIPIVKRMKEDGHVLGLHTRINSTKYCYSNPYHYYTDLDILNDHIEAYTGTRSVLLRFPGGTGNARSNALTMRRIVNGADDLGYRVFDWTVSAADTAIDASHQKACNIIFSNCVHNQEIILMHDLVFTPEVIKTIVPVLRERGYVFETLDHYPEQSYCVGCRYSHYNEDVPAESLLMKTETAEIMVDEKKDLTVSLIPSNSTDFVTWRSSDESIVKVDKGGKITGISVGESVITARSTSGKTAECRVTVLLKS